MRVVILFNPYISVEKATDKMVAEKIIGFNYNGDIENDKKIAKSLRELADILESGPIKNDTSN